MWRRPVVSVHPWRVGAHKSSRPLSGVFNSFSSAADDTTLAENAALRQQLEFCCLVCGWDTPCSTCPFDWRGFDPKERYRVLRRSPKSLNELQGAMKLLELIPADSEPTKTQRLSVNKVKAAFRRKALEWHPDCNKEPGAEEKFREILDAYELLLAVLTSPA